MRLPWKIVKNPPLPKIDRQLELEHFYTFKDGTELFTYQISDLAKISGRHLDKVREVLNFQLQYGAGPDQVRAWSGNIDAMLLRAIEEPHPQKRLDLVIEARELAKKLPKLQDYVDDIHLKHWHSLYTMFFVISGENELLFSPKYNEKKIQLLEAEGEEFAETVFFFLENLMIHLSDTYRLDIIQSTIQERELTELAASLSSITSTSNRSTKSKSPGIIT